MGLFSLPCHHAGATGAQWSKVGWEVIAATHTGEVLNVCVCKAFVQELLVGLVLVIVMFGSRVGVHVDVIRCL